MIYLSYGNQGHGVYSSYVIENCKFISNELGYPVKIIALISIRNFFKTRKIRKDLYPNSILIPMIPGFHRWNWNLFTLILLWPLVGRKKVMALSPLAASLALKLKAVGLVNTVIYDGEGATAAEWNEFDVVANTKLKRDIWEIEREVVLKSDLRRAVSHKMIDYWKRSFNYNSKQHIVIPCLLNGVFLKDSFQDEKSEALGNNKITFVYSGSGAQWQSLAMVEDLFIPLFNQNPNFEILLLSDIRPEESILIQLFPDRVKLEWLPFEQVPARISKADYGILLRNPSVTNEVAAPTKFAEYLACGLKVLISPGIGDYSDWVIKFNCGYLIAGQDDLLKQDFKKLQHSEKQDLRKMALNYFSRENFRSSFEQIISI